MLVSQPQSIVNREHSPCLSLSPKWLWSVIMNRCEHSQYLSLTPKRLWSVIMNRCETFPHACLSVPKVAMVSHYEEKAVSWFCLVTSGRGGYKYISVQFATETAEYYCESMRRLLKVMVTMMMVMMMMMTCRAQICL